MDRDFDKTIAFIGGSGLAQGLEGILEDVKKFENIQNEFGTVLSYYVGYSGNTRVVILPRHGDSLDTPSRSPAELVDKKGYEANIWQLYELEVEAVFGLTAVGALDTYTPLADQGSFIIPDSYIRGFGASQHSFGNKALNVHTNMSKPFDIDLRRKSIEAIEKAGYEARKEGLYIYNTGDAFETPDEILALHNLTKKSWLPELFEKHIRKKRNRLVGMTTVPEAILLKQMNIPFVAIASNVNYAEGLSKKTLVSHEQTMNIMETAGKYLTTVVENIIRSYEK